MKTVFITGTSSGIGRASAHLFSKHGWNVIASMRSNQDPSEFNAISNVSVVQCDVKDPDSVDQAIKNSISLYGGIDVLVNNAGVYDTAPFESYSADRIANVMDTNLMGAMNAIKAVLPHYREKNAGLIINVSSVAGFASFPYQSVYHASKWALEGFSESLRYELNKFNIKIKIVEPGMVKTNIYDNISCVTLQPEYTESFKKWYAFLNGMISKGYGPEVTAKTIYKAAISSSSRFRYPSGYDAKITYIMKKVLPYRMFNYIVNKVMV